jgi:N-acetyl-anhydromuramyl-L-alanine amidase AmpD
MSMAAAASALALTTTGLALASIPSSASTTHPRSTGQDCLSSIGSGPAAQERQRAFAAASRTYGVPSSVLLGVSYMESRWDDHGTAPSTAGGYGPMHLTKVSVEQAGDAKGDGTFNRSTGPDSLHTTKVASGLTGLSVHRLISDDAANICGGAALLASYQRDLGKARGTATPTSSWYTAVKRYSGDSAAFEKSVFASRVFATIKSGESRRTIDGQKITLTSQPSLAVPAAKTSTSTAGTQAGKHLDCPASLDCQWVPAPYEQYGTSPSQYGNHDIANREQNLSIDYIVIHDTEGLWKHDLDLVQDPTYLAWNYTIRSRDGKVAQHLDAKDIGFQAGNWYVNMHSLGIEHEGFAAQGAQWYTESLYENSATLVRYLANKYTVKLDRAHIIGHDQVPGILPGNVAGMHWDPGPYWDWEHYMSLLHAPILADGPADSNVVTVKPGFDDNVQTVTGCDSDPNTADTCPTQGTNFVYLHQQPSATSPLVTDRGLHSDGSPSTTKVSDHGARVDAGQKLVVAERQGDWLKVWYLGAPGWLYSPASDPNVVPSTGRVVTAKAGASEVPVYGRAYPEESAYAGTPVPYQTVTPLQYTIKAGQQYVLADDTIDTNYYYAKTFDSSLPGDHTVVTGQDKYDEIWFGHRMFYVRAADIQVN